MKIQVLQADITQQAVDAIVNAANSGLLGGGGVDGAIHRAAGKELLAECQAILDEQGTCPNGQAVITKAAKLPSRYVIHAVGPIWHGGDQKEKQTLASAYQHCIAIAEDHQLNSIAFPNISTGIYGFPKPLAAEIVSQVINQYIPYANSVNEIRFICFDDENYQLYQQAFN